MESGIMRGLNEIKDKGGLQTRLGEALGPGREHTGADSQLAEHSMRTEEKDLKGKDTHRLIIEVAERLFRQLGFQKTTVADIARELRMSPANVYRFFAAKSEINAAVCKELLASIEAEAEKIAASRGSTAQRIRNLIASIERAHHKRYMYDRKLPELVAAILEQIIASGMASGELKSGDATLAAHLVSTACIRFCHPRLMVEYDQKPEPALDQMIDFCLSALTREAA